MVRKLLAFRIADLASAPSLCDPKFSNRFQSATSGTMGEDDCANFMFITLLVGHRFFTLLVVCDRDCCVDTQLWHLLMASCRSTISHHTRLGDLYCSLNEVGSGACHGRHTPISRLQSTSYASECPLFFQLCRGEVHVQSFRFAISGSRREPSAFWKC